MQEKRKIKLLILIICIQITANSFSAGKNSNKKQCNKLAENIIIDSFDEPEQTITNENVLIYPFLILK